MGMFRRKTGRSEEGGADEVGMGKKGD